MKDTTLSFRVTADLAARLAEHAAANDQTVSAFLASLVEHHLDQFDPGLVLGYIRLGSSEVIGSECPECGQPMADVWLGFTAGHGVPVPFGPVCGLCATTE